MPDGDIRVGVVGLGTIGRSVVEAAMEGALSGVAWGPCHTRTLSPELKDWAAARDIPLAADVDEVIARNEVILECASAAAARDILPRAVAKGRAVLSVSVAAMVDDGWRRSLMAMARTTGARILIPGGAVAGMDLFAALRTRHIDSVCLTTRKPPRAIPGFETVSTATEAFRGPARLAAERFPQNLNVAATVALAGIGLDATEVVLVADPKVTQNRHEIVVEAVAGRYHLIFENAPSPTNPKTSALTADSVVALLGSLQGRLLIGGFSLNETPG